MEEEQENDEGCGDSAGGLGSASTVKSKPKDEAHWREKEGQEEVREEVNEDGTKREVWDQEIITFA